MVASSITRPFVLPRSYCCASRWIFVDSLASGLPRRQLTFSYVTPKYVALHALGMRIVMPPVPLLLLLLLLRYCAGSPVDDISPSTHRRGEGGRSESVLARGKPLQFSKGYANRLGKEQGDSPASNEPAQRGGWPCCVCFRVKVSKGQGRPGLLCVQLRIRTGYGIAPDGYVGRIGR